MIGQFVFAVETVVNAGDSLVSPVGGVAESQPATSVPIDRQKNRFKARMGIPRFEVNSK